MSEGDNDHFGNSWDESARHQSWAIAGLMRFVGAFVAIVLVPISLFVGGLSGFALYVGLGKHPFGGQDFRSLYYAVLFLSAWLVLQWILKRLKSREAGLCDRCILVVIVVLEILALARIFPQMVF